MFLFDVFCGFLGNVLGQSAACLSPHLFQIVSQVIILGLELNALVKSNDVLSQEQSDMLKVVLLETARIFASGRAL